MDSTTESSREIADRHRLRHCFGAFATGVVVVTVGGSSPHGMTANAFTSVSLDPPLLLVCIEQTAVMHEALMTNKVFGVSVLASDHEAAARHFADRQRPLGKAQFEHIGWTAGEQTGAPLIDGALARFECELWRWYDGGDHTIFLGRLLSLDRQADTDALLFLNGRFHGSTERTDSPT